MEQSATSPATERMSLFEWNSASVREVEKIVIDRIANGTRLTPLAMSSPLSFEKNFRRGAHRRDLYVE